ASGSPLPEGPTTLSVLHQVATGGWRPKVPTTFPGSIQAALSRMVEFDPAKRPSAAEVPALLGRRPATPLSPPADAPAQDTLPPQFAVSDGPNAAPEAPPAAPPAPAPAPRAREVAQADAMSTLPPMLAAKRQAPPPSETRSFERRVSAPAPR